jgi:hypothetical protein
MRPGPGSFGTQTTEGVAAEVAPSGDENAEALRQLHMIAYGVTPVDAEVEGHKFGLPELPLPANLVKARRYNSMLDQLTRLLMRDGKLSKAQRVRTRPHPSYGLTA